MDSDAKDCVKGGGLKDEPPACLQGTKRFVASVLANSVTSAQYLVRIARKHPGRARLPFSRASDERLLNGCAAWLWLQGRGNEAFTFEEVSWFLGWDPTWIRDKFMAPFGDVRDINKWVEKRVDSFGPLCED